MSERSVTSPKFCVFCGEKPAAKTKEHVVPRWLIELTGSDKRLANFGPVWDKPGTIRKFAFDAFHFPACRKCNDEFSALEGKTRVIVTRLLDGHGATGLDLSTLLDWLDKVRIGLWLGMSMLDRNMANIRPTFYIRQRMRMHDRSVVFYRCLDSEPRLNFVGTVGLGFQHSPCCFALRVNHILMLNASWIGLCAEYIGFPFMRTLSYQDDKLSIAGDLGRGTGVLTDRVSKVLDVPGGGREFHQAAFVELLNNPDAATYYTEEHVQRYCRGMPGGTSQVFLKRKNAIMRPVRAEETVQVVPATALSDEAALFGVAQATLRIQLQSFLQGASFDKLDPEVSARIREKVAYIERLNVMLLERERQAFRNLGYL